MVSQVNTLDMDDSIDVRVRFILTFFSRLCPLSVLVPRDCSSHPSSLHTPQRQGRRKRMIKDYTTDGGY